MYKSYDPSIQLTRFCYVTQTYFIFYEYSALARHKYYQHNRNYLYWEATLHDSVNKKNLLNIRKCLRNGYNWIKLYLVLYVNLTTLDSWAICYNPPVV